jgi:hypothetical protein
MAYNKTTWVNDSAPYIDSTNLNKIEQGIEDAHTFAIGNTALLKEIDIPGGVYISDSKYEFSLDMTASGVFLKTFMDLRGSTNINMRQYITIDDQPSVRYSYENLIPGENLNMNILDLYSNNNTITSGRDLQIRGLPSGGSWAGNLSVNAVVQGANGENMRTLEFLGDTTTAAFYSTLGDYGKSDGLGYVSGRQATTPLSPNQSEYNFWKFSGPEAIAGISRGDVMFILTGSSYTNTTIKAKPIYIENVDSVKNGVYSSAFRGDLAANIFSTTKWGLSLGKAQVFDGTQLGLENINVPNNAQFTDTSIADVAWIKIAGCFVVITDTTTGEKISGTVTNVSLSEGSNFILGTTGLPLPYEYRGTNTGFVTNRGAGNYEILVYSPINLLTETWNDISLPSIPANNWGIGGSYASYQISSYTSSQITKASDLTSLGPDEDFYTIYIPYASALFIGATVSGSFNNSTIYDFSNSTDREGNAFIIPKQGITQIGANITSAYGTWFSNDGTSYYIYTEDPVNNSDWNDTEYYIKRKIAKFENDQWYFNNAVDATAYSDGDLIQRQAFKTAFEGPENWYAVPGATNIEAIGILLFYLDEDASLIEGHYSKGTNKAANDTTEDMLLKTVLTTENSISQHPIRDMYTQSFIWAGWSQYDASREYYNIIQEPTGTKIQLSLGDQFISPPLKIRVYGTQIA